VPVIVHLLSLTALTEVNPDKVRPGWVALLIVLALAGATFLLWRNMGKQMKKIDFDEDATEPKPKENGENGAEQPR
jgi:hypothetical protein